jgi:hypothetical protein
MDAIVTAQPVNLGMFPTTPGNPELTFKHQINLMDYRYINALFMQAPDRGVVEMQLADAAGNPVGLWQKINPYENVYDIQPSTNYINCTFDPDDDGNNEDSYFDPTDPNRAYGPSSTCFPEFNFGSQGWTDYALGFVSGNVNRASDDPVGLQGSIDRGNWVQTKFNLERYRGRRASVRFLTSTIKIYDNTDPISFGFPSGRFNDDGWYIDDVEISNTLTSPTTMVADTKNNSALPACPANCTSVTANLTASPTTTLAPGQPVTLDASASAASTCIGGVLQYQFYVNSVLARDWTDNAFFTDTPLAATRYDVTVRCSTATSCSATTIGSKGPGAQVGVNCPGTGNDKWPSPFIAQPYNPGGPLHVDKTGGLGGAEPDQNLTVSWGTNPSWSDVIRGDLNVLRATSTFTGSVLDKTCDKNAKSLVDNTVLATGSSYYFLARGSACNVTPFSYLSMDSFQAKVCSNNASRVCRLTADCVSPGTCTVAMPIDTLISADPNSCP